MTTVTTVFFFPEPEDAPMFVGSFKYPGKLSPTAVVREIAKNHQNTFSRLYSGHEDEDECVFQVIRGNIGSSHYSIDIDYEDANVIISAGYLRSLKPDPILPVEMPIEIITAN